MHAGNRNTCTLVGGAVTILNYCLGSGAKCFCWEQVHSPNALMAFRLGKEIWLKAYRKIISSTQKERGWDS